MTQGTFRFSCPSISSTLVCVYVCPGIRAHHLQLMSHINNQILQAGAGELAGLAQVTGPGLSVVGPLPQTWLVCLYILSGLLR